MNFIPVWQTERKAAKRGKQSTINTEVCPENRWELQKTRLNKKNCMNCVKYSKNFINYISIIPKLLKFCKYSCNSAEFQLVSFDFLLNRVCCCIIPTKVAESSLIFAKER